MGNSRSAPSAVLLNADMRIPDFTKGYGMDFALNLGHCGGNQYSDGLYTSRQMFQLTKEAVQEILRRMEERWMQVKVVIWRHQCEHLLARYREGGAMIGRELDALRAENSKGGPMVSRNSRLVDFICSTLIRSMLEGEACLLFCSEKENYARAAFALSSPRPPSRNTFSRFGLVLRELDWTVDFIRCIGQQYVDGKRLSFDDWKWCERTCRLVLIQGGFVAEEKILEADNLRQACDRDAFNSKPSSFSRNKKLEAIWSKRLSATSQLSERDSLPDCFWIDNPGSFEFVDHLGKGSFKKVEKSKWLGETVAVALSQDYPKELLVREAGLLARVQHPNVVELLGCAFKTDAREKSTSFLVTELMEQDLDTLISQQLRRNGGSETSREGPPFALSVAVDIALQIVEAMVHVRECQVMHRDLKPGNCLVSPKFKFKYDGLMGLLKVPMYYTVKLIDFGTSKLRGTQDSNFHTRTGTASYMAPELFVSPMKPYTWSADVWSFGMTCYKIFTGKDPFETSVQRESPGKRPKLPHVVPLRLQKLMKKCWAEDPAQRPTIHKVREDLWQCKMYYPGTGKPATLYPGVNF